VEAGTERAPSWVARLKPESREWGMCGTCVRGCATIAALALLLVGCASRPINPRLEVADRTTGYRAEGRAIRGAAGDTMIVLAFSGGGTRAAAFSYGVLEELRRTELMVNNRKTRMLDEVDVITGVSGGSFTALAFALYGDRLFDEYEQRFLKRDVQAALVARFLSPLNWPSLASNGWGRSELAAAYYDEILFEGKTFGDLVGEPGPIAIASATDISTGSRLAFTQGDFDIICSDLSKVPLSRAAAASSAVPFVLSPVTINNYGGTCGYKEPAWTREISDPEIRARPAGRALQRYKEMQSFEDSAARPYLHLVDGGVSDNLGMRAVLEGLEQIEINRALGRPSRIDRLRRIVVIVVNSLSVPHTNWDQSERPPSDALILLKATGVPIDRYSYESVELLKDLISRWQTLRSLKAAAAFANGGNLALSRATDVPDIELYAIDVSFDAIPDLSERAYLNSMPTSFSLSDEQVDHLRAAAATAMHESSEYRRLLRDLTNAPSTSTLAPVETKQ
jgi:NTE family protein